jgi:hypothetical protein
MSEIGDARWFMVKKNNPRKAYLAGIGWGICFACLDDQSSRRIEIKVPSASVITRYG